MESSRIIWFKLILFFWVCCWVGIIQAEVGDLDNDADVDIADSIVGLQIISGQRVPVQISGDIDTDQQIGFPEVIFALRTEAFCGNGILDGWEVCDDGNRLNGDGCSSICQCEIPGCDGNYQITFVTAGQYYSDGRNFYSDLFWRFPLSASSPECISLKLTPFDLVDQGGSDSDYFFPLANGEKYILTSNRFNTASKAYAVTLVDADLGALQTLTIDGSPISAYWPRLSPDGDTLVYVKADFPNANRIFRTSRQSGIWQTPVELLPASPFSYHRWLSLSPDGARVVFTGGSTFNTDHVAEVGVDGSNFRILASPSDKPNTSGGTLVFSPSYEIDGGIVFQANWVISGQLWRRTPDGSFSQIAPDQIYDRSPIVLPDGRIASVWSGNAETNGTAHIKIMAPDGSSYEMLTMPGRFAGVDDIVDSRHDAGLGVGFWSAPEPQPIPEGASIQLFADALYTAPNGYITLTVVHDNFLGENIWYTWEVPGESRTASRQPLVVPVSDIGAQTITITAENGLQQAAAQLSVTVADEPWQVILAASSNSGFAPFDVQLSVECRYQREPVSLNTYDWDFGDGTVTYDGGPQIVHSYSSGGTFTATVTVTDNDGATKTESITIQVTEPQVAASVSPLEGIAPLAVDFTATAEDFGGSDLTYSWNFGDGTIETGGQNVQHTYSAGGDYAASVTVSDGHSEVTVETVVSVVEPLITLNASPAYGVAPFTVNLSTTDLNLEGIVSYTWSIDGGAALPGGTVRVHEFASPGVYSVTVTADNGSYAAQDTLDIVVLDTPPTVEIGTDLTTGNAPLAAFFDILLEDWQLPVAVDWQVDGVTQGDNEWLAHTFAADGTFTVTATVTDGVFTTADTVSVVVGGRPGAQQALGPQGGTVALGGVTFSLPAGVVSTNADFSLTEISASATAPWLQAEGMVALSPLYLYESGIHHVTPATLVMPFDAALVQGNHANIAVVHRAIFHNDFSDARESPSLSLSYLPEPAAVDTQNNTVSLPVHGPGAFQVVLLPAPLDVVTLGEFLQARQETAGANYVSPQSNSTQDLDVRLLFRKDPTKMDRANYTSLVFNAIISADLRFRTQLGFVMPKTPIIIYVDEVKKKINGKTVHVAGAVSTDRPGDIEIGFDLSENEIMRTVPHEYFHCIQFSSSNDISLVTNFDASSWILEGTAEWATDEVFDLLAGGYNAPEVERFSEPLKSFDDRPTTPYEAVAFWKWAESKQPGIINGMLQHHMNNTHGLVDAGTVKKNNSVFKLEESFTAIWPADFHAFARDALFYKDFELDETGMGDLWHDEKLNSAKVVAGLVEPTILVKNEPGESEANPLALSYSLEPHLTAAQFWFETWQSRTTGLKGKLHIRFDPIPSGQTISVSAYTYRGNETGKPVIVERTFRDVGGSTPEFTMPFGYDNRVMLLITDSNWEDAKPTDTPYDGNVTVWVEDPCGDDTSAPAAYVTNAEDLVKKLSTVPDNSTIEIAPGTYYLQGANQYNSNNQFLGRSCLKLSRGITIKGSGMDRTYLVGSGTYDSAVIVDGNGCAIKALTILATGNYVYNPAGRSVIGISGNNLSAFTLCSVRLNCGGIGYDGGGMGLLLTNGGGPMVLDVIDSEIITASNAPEGPQYLVAFRLESSGGDVDLTGTNITGWYNSGEIFTCPGCQVHVAADCSKITDNLFNAILVNGETGSSPRYVCQ